MLKQPMMLGDFLVQTLVISLALDTATSVSVEYTQTTSKSSSAPGKELDLWAHLDDLPPLAARICFPGFVCAYGNCSMESGGPACHCLPGYIDLFCQSECPLDCGMFGKCRLDSDGNPVCLCHPGYTGSNCSQPRTEEETTTSASGSEMDPWAHLNDLPPLAARICLPGFVCAYGNCSLENRGPVCHCLPGYIDVFCHTECNLDCGMFGKCRLNDGKPVCHCHPGYTGINCSQPRTEEETTTSVSVEYTQTTSKSSSATGTEMDPWAHLDDLPPLAARICFPGFVCAYGNCSLESGGPACHCLPGYIDLFCRTRCPLDCGTFGECSFNDGKPICYCDSGYTGVNCSTIRTTEEPEKPSSDGEERVFLGIAVACVMLVLLVTLASSYFLWRRRNITMMRIVYWFQPVEEDDDRDYDAFVSYASTELDTQFVLETLLPKLENSSLGFTLCIHQRNFMPGLFITDNIAESVKKSRRTILILSPAFINSGWCKFEYQVALQEMLSQKHRILPILLEDICDLKDQMDDTLKTILNTVSWLEYPRCKPEQRDLDKFWTRLSLSMPKKRTSRSNSVTSESSTVQTPTSMSEISFPTNSVSSESSPVQTPTSLSDISFPTTPESSTSTMPFAQLDLTDIRTAEPTS